MRGEKLQVYDLVRLFHLSVAFDSTVVVVGWLVSWLVLSFFFLSFLSFFSSSFHLSLVFFLSFFLRFRYFSLPIILIGKWFASRLGRSEVLTSLRHYLRAQNQEHHTSIEEQRGTARQSSVKGTRRTIV